ncbi:MOSC domain-containing protein [Octadecabacter ascidiaceicola]|uniref:MOSC domain protein n=1 Tax=Octadecabacter ascidiaceicola TaxID=1655543 RepID=A0A238K9Q8_9RHOB|nr:MOSC N-terminal beta barrel domain-containing protein [Octadecabacter ascidiaceicola]SMX39589.1 MOSC domain protein [Octadecabacter ascidiaceicola]
MGTVAELWRHPIKSHGRETLAAVDLQTGKCLPWDRHWAVTHDLTKFDGSGWVMCRNFMIGSRTPNLAGIWAELDEATGQITLRHQDLGAITFNPNEDAPAFLDWVAPLCPTGRAVPTGIVSVEGRGMTDSDYPSVSIMTRSSHAAVEDAIGQPLEHERWRGNIWLNGTQPFEEFDWIGKTIRIGTAELEIREPIERCMHTASNPVTGERDADTLGTLNSKFGHQNFGVYAVVTKDGHVALSDQAEVL